MKLQKNFPVGLFSISLIFLLCALFSAACNGGGGGDDVGDNVDNIPAGAIEGDTGIVYVDGVECFGPDAQPVSGDSIYVSATGSDSNNGLSEETPFRTLAKALCNVEAGQTVYLMQGVYTDSVIMGDFGDSSSPVTISGVLDNGARPVIDGERVRTFGIAVSESKNFVFENIEFKNFTDAGLYVMLTDGVTVNNCVFADSGFNGINSDFGGEGFGVVLVEDKNVLVQNSETYGIGPEADRVAQGYLGTQINLYGVENGQVTNNKTHDSNGCGVLAEECVNVVISGNEVYNNQLYGGYWDAGVWLDGGHHVTVENNNIHDNLGPAIQASDSELQYPYGSCRYTVSNNTITNNYWAFASYNMMSCPLPATTYLVYENNTTSGNVYPGDDQEVIDGTSGDILCLLWPCGENTPCVDPEPGGPQGEKVCEQ